MNKELAWFAMPICGILSQIGGTWWKPARRFGIGITLSLTLTLVGISPYKSILCGVLISIPAFLPFTIGKDDKWRWWWCVILSVLMTAPSLILRFDVYPVLVCASIISACFILSNWKLQRYFPWKFVEFTVWSAAVYPYILSASV